MRVKQSGFTLIELIIYIAIVGAVVTALILFSLSQMQARSKQYALGEVQANGRVAMETMGERIRRAEGINVGGSTLGSSPGVLSLVMADAAVNPTVFRVESGQLVMEEGVSPAVSLTTGLVEIRSLVFRELSGGGARGNVGIELIVGYVNPSNDVYYEAEQHLETSVSLRE